MMIAVIIFICCATFLGGLIAFYYKDNHGLITAFSAGLVTGVFFFDLLPEALSLAADHYSNMFVMTIVALGFVAYLVFDRLAWLHTTKKATATPLRASLAAGSFSLHGLFDGLAVGMAFHISRYVGLLLGLAIIIHAISDGLNTVAVVIQKRGLRKTSLIWLLVNSMMPLAGLAVSFFYHPAQERLALLIALFAGFFLYLGASDLLPESQHTHPSWLNTAVTILGMAIMFGASRLFSY
ncbi:hypothetical protein D3H65_09415 [Paraflavitalea soli]|uniref:Permease n=1 Tax=Paraflavitalea soli TaxID=2315862 RepID=A0A3B7MLJ8_9BACT|nr:ZIP family metal transporter [Paraflavitalea soli]AXY74179.1 hypothetical protein D3H65_09415 [Paraflavitalea soli]